MHRDAIRRRPRAVYERLINYTHTCYFGARFYKALGATMAQKWGSRTVPNSRCFGGALEYSWHMVMGQARDARPHPRCVHHQRPSQRQSIIRCRGCGDV